jgi:hypothetical protein
LSVKDKGGVPAIIHPRLLNISSIGGRKGAYIHQMSQVNIAVLFAVDSFMISFIKTKMLTN